MSIPNPFDTPRTSESIPFGASSDPFASTTPSTTTSPISSLGSDPFGASSDPFASTTSPISSLGSDPFASTTPAPAPAPASSTSTTSPISSTSSSASGTARSASSASGSASGSVTIPNPNFTEDISASWLNGDKDFLNSQDNKPQQVEINTTNATKYIMKIGRITKKGDLTGDKTLIDISVSELAGLSNGNNSINVIIWRDPEHQETKSIDFKTDHTEPLIGDAVISWGHILDPQEKESDGFVDVIFENGSFKSDPTPPKITMIGEKKGIVSLTWDLVNNRATINTSQLQKDFISNQSYRIKLEAYDTSCNKIDKVIGEFFVSDVEEPDTYKAAKVLWGKKEINGKSYIEQFMYKYLYNESKTFFEKNSPLLTTISNKVFAMTTIRTIKWDFHIGRKRFTFKQETKQLMEAFFKVLGNPLKVWPTENETTKDEGVITYQERQKIIKNRLKSEGVKDSDLLDPKYWKEEPDTKFKLIKNPADSELRHVYNNVVLQIRRNSIDTFKSFFSYKPVISRGGKTRKKSKRKSVRKTRSKK
jgi:hypothetical protein